MVLDSYSHHGLTHIMALLTPWSYSHHGLTHIMVLFISWSCSHHGLELLFTSWSYSHHGLTHIMVLFTSWSYSHHGLTHTMVLLTSWSYSHHGLRLLFTSWSYSHHGLTHTMVLLTSSVAFIFLLVSFITKTNNNRLGALHAFLVEAGVYLQELTWSDCYSSLVCSYIGSNILNSASGAPSQNGGSSTNARARCLASVGPNLLSTSCLGENIIFQNTSLTLYLHFTTQNISIQIIIRQKCKCKQCFIIILFTELLVIHRAFFQTKIYTFLVLNTDVDQFRIFHILHSGPFTHACSFLLTKQILC